MSASHRNSGAAWTLTPGIGARIGGNAVAGEPHVVLDPATGATIATVGWVGPDVARDAVAEAGDAFDVWRATETDQRVKALTGIATDLRNEAAGLARLISAESGKRLVEALAEVDLSARYFEWFAGLAHLRQDRTTGAGGGRTTVSYQPVGVVAAVSPWNFPLSIPARKVAPALAAGCTVVQKASEVTPLTSLAFTEICERHVPASVVNVVVGDGSTLTGALLDAEQVAAVTFTGSTAAGLAVATRAASSLTRVTLELAGRAPFIVTEQADVEVALATLLVAKFRNNGASCIAANNVFVHASLAGQFLPRLEEGIAALRVGHPHDPNTDLGPIVSAAHAARLESLVAEAAEDGCRIARGQQPNLAHGLNPTAYVAPTLIDATQSSATWDEEVFGPICQVRSYTSEDAVVAEVNGWRAGLGGYIVSTERDRAARLAARLRIGIVGVNTGSPNSPDVPFGGFDRAGLGREGGRSGLLAFLEEQTVAGNG